MISGPEFKPEWPTFGEKGGHSKLQQLSPQTLKVCCIPRKQYLTRLFIISGKENICPKLSSFGSETGHNRPSPCRNDSDCSDSKVCCKTRKGERGCVDPPTKMPDGRLKPHG